MREPNPPTPFPMKEGYGKRLVFAELLCETQGVAGRAQGVSPGPQESQNPYRVKTIMQRS